MKALLNGLKGPINRRSFVKSVLKAASAATVGAGVLLSSTSPVLANGGSEQRSGHPVCLGLLQRNAIFVLFFPVHLLAASGSSECTRNTDSRSRFGDVAPAAV